MPPQSHIGGHAPQSRFLISAPAPDPNPLIPYLHPQPHRPPEIPTAKLSDFPLTPTDHPTLPTEPHQSSHQTPIRVPNEPHLQTHGAENNALAPRTAIHDLYLFRIWQNVE